MNCIQLFHAFAGNNQNYRPRCCGRPDPLSPEARPPAIVDRVVHSTDGERIDCCRYKALDNCLLPNQCKSKLRLTSPSAYSGDSQYYRQVLQRYFYMGVVTHRAIV